MSKYLSYAQFVKDRAAFRKAGTNSGDAFNIYDTASHKYFKILFYFGGSSNTNLSTNADGLTSGLLAPTWEIFKDTKNIDYYNYNSAWAYLKMNNENERADKLEHFVTLLSNISTYSPWYFSTVSGVQEALERKITEGGTADFGEQRKLSISCLPDAFDNRITTLLDLYRDVTWSWIHKKEIIPANLRKFDMAIYIFESPILGWHKTSEDNSDSLDNGIITPSYKMIEFHDCEFNYNSIKSGWNELNNQTGNTPTYTIDISYNDCYEISHNDILLKDIGDIIATDTYQAVLINEVNISKLDSVVPVTAQVQKLQNDSIINNELTKNNIDNINSNKSVTLGNLENGSRTENSVKKIKNEYESGFVSNALGQVASHLVSDISSVAKRAVLGNIHTYSLTQIKDQIDDALQGNLIKTGMTVAQYIKSGQQRASMKIKNKPVGNIFN